MKENRGTMEAYAERQHVLQGSLLQETCVLKSGKSCSRSHQCTRGFMSQLQRVKAHVACSNGHSF